MDPSERPRLREGLELLLDQPEELGSGLVYDPARRALFDLAPEDRAVLPLLDGSRSPREIARQSGRPLDDVLDLLDDLADMMLLEDPEQAEVLEAWRRNNEREDLLLQPILDSRPVEEVDTLAVHVVDDARHTCVCCGDCCHYAVPVSAEERERLEGMGWPAEIIPPEAGRLFQVRPSTQWGRLEGVIATRSDPTRCAFLDEENLCRVHARSGAPAKPFACRLFPLAYPVAAPEEVLFSLTFECPWIFDSYDTGERLADRPEDLRALLEEMEEVYVLPASIPLDGLAEIGLAGYLSWEKALLDAVDAPAEPATEPTAFLDWFGEHWHELSAQPGPIPGPDDLASLAHALQRCVQANRSTLAESPEREAGVVWAGRVLESLASQPEAAWAALPWVDGPAADRFLSRFARHFVEGKQHLFYRPLWMGLRVLSVLLLLARYDAGMMDHAAKQRGALTGENLNRALSRWCRLFDIRPLRLALLGTSRQGAKNAEG